MTDPHILVAAVGSAGDMYPYLYIACTLIARGHRVTLLGPTAHAALAEAAQVPFVGLGSEADYLDLLDDPEVWHPRKGFRVLWRGMHPGLALLSGFIAARPAGEHVALLAHPLALPAAALARAQRPGLRVVTAWLAPANLRSLHDPLTLGPLRIPPWLPRAWRQALWRCVDATVVDPVALPQLNAARQIRGLAPVAHFLDHLQTTADASLALFPPWFAATPPDWPRTLAEGVFPLYDPHSADGLPRALDRFLEAGPPPVVFTPGSANRQAARWFERALAATRWRGGRAIFLTPHRAQVPTRLPADVLWQPYVPLRMLLPRCAALVHHGGIGTTAEALRAGIAQLILPLAYDQFDNAARVEALAAGGALASWRARPRALAAALDQLLQSPQVRQGCAAAARRIAGDDPACLGTLLERQLELGRGRG